MKKAIAPVLLLCGLFLVSCEKNTPPLYRQSRALLDTFVTITVSAESEEKAGAGIEKAFSEIGRFGALIDFFSEESELAEINRSAGVREVKVSPETLDLVEKAIEAAEKSGGAFDPTVGVISRLWDFHKQRAPESAEISRNLPLVGFRGVVIDNKKSTVFLKEKGMLLDLGGIAKGYAADLAVEVLRKNGVSAGIVAVAGDIRTFGLKPGAGAWNVGIRNPRRRDSSDELIASVKLNDLAISTSGDYERFFISGGRRYHHLLDPSTGYPAEGCRSVSVVAERGVFADAFSTAVFVLGHERGMEFFGRMGIEGIIVDKDGGIHVTPGLKGRLKIETGG